MSKERLTICEGMKLFSNYLFIKGKAESTIKSYNSDMQLFKTFIKEKLNNKIRYVDEITKVEVQQYKEFMLEKVANGKMERRTVDRKFNAFKTFFKFLEEDFGIENIIKDDDFGNRKDSYDSGRDYLPNILSEKEVNLILNAAKEDTDKNKFRDYAMLVMLATLGCRRSEVLNLKWTDINFVVNSKCKFGTIQIVRPKSNNADILPMTKILRDALIDYKKTITTIKHEYVFISREGNQLSKSAFTSAINKYVQKSGLDKNKNFKITAHTFRHSFITTCFRKEIPVDKILRYTGHRDKESLKIYTHLVSEDLTNVADIFDDMYAA